VFEQPKTVRALHRAATLIGVFTSSVLVLACDWRFVFAKTFNDKIIVSFLPVYDGFAIVKYINKLVKLLYFHNT
jgi:hypothetical protein